MNSKNARFELLSIAKYVKSYVKSLRICKRNETLSCTGKIK